jgi:hypothetical protein
VRTQYMRDIPDCSRLSRSVLFKVRNHSRENDIPNRARLLLSLIIVGAIVLFGATAFATSQSSVPAGPHIPKSGGLVNLTAYSNNDGPTSVVILSGAMADYGKAVRETPNGSSGNQHIDLDLSLTRGTLTLNITEVENKLEKAIYGHFPTNEGTCSGIVTVTGEAPIVTDSGSGAYKTVHGTLDLTVAINEVESWPACPQSDTAPSLAQSVFISGSGMVSRG